MDTGSTVSVKKPIPLWLWIPRIVAAFLLLQTLPYKFSANHESVWIFSQIHAEPWGRITTGVLELFAGMGLLWNGTIRYASLLTVIMMSGALLTHIFVIGIEVDMDHGLLFEYALVAWICSIVLLFKLRIK